MREERGEREEGTEVCAGVAWAMPVVHWRPEASGARVVPSVRWRPGALFFLPRALALQDAPASALKSEPALAPKYAPASAWDSGNALALKCAPASTRESGRAWRRSVRRRRPGTRANHWR